MESLDTVKHFAFGGIGAVGAPNPGETLTLELARQPDAVEAFAWLAGNSRPVAQLYAYWALRTLAPERAQTYAAALEADWLTIETMSGCLIGAATVRSIALGMKAPGNVWARPMRIW